MKPLNGYGYPDVPLIKVPRKFDTKNSRGKTEMILQLDEREVSILAGKGLVVPEGELSIDEAIEFEDKVRDLEVYYAQEGTEDLKKADVFADIADNIWEQIEEASQDEDE